MKAAVRCPICRCFFCRAPEGPHCRRANINIPNGSVLVRQRCPACHGRLEPKPDDGIGPEVYGVAEWRCSCGTTQVSAAPIDGVRCRLCGAPAGPMEHCGRAHAKAVGGTHPEPSVTLRIPASGFPIAPFPACAGAGHHNEVVALPLGLWRPVDPISAAWLVGVRRRTGPWVQVRFAPGQWRELQRRAPWILKASDALRLGAPQQAERFRDLFRPYETWNAGGGDTGRAAP